MTHPSRPSAEPLLWMLFSAGGVLSALVLPAIALVFGLAVPLGWVPAPAHERLVALVAHPLIRVAIFLVCALSLAHWAHRFRYTLYDGLQIKHLNELVNLLCYGGAAAGSLAAAYVLWRLG